MSDVLDRSAYEKPTVIFLDAVGTLFGVRGSVGQVYSEVAQRFGVEIASDALDRAFYQSFRVAGQPAFNDKDPAAIRTKEYDWWRQIATNSFTQVGVFEQFQDFEAFFAQLYAHFATADPWFLYPDVLPTLERWRELDIQLGILSNFDSRLYAVLDALELAHFFDSITISTEAGAAKPDRQIFEIAYQAACAVGMRGIWLRRR
jgi:putative hydrolase of the HAD superfamily